MGCISEVKITYMLLVMTVTHCSYFIHYLDWKGTWIKFITIMRFRSMEWPEKFCSLCQTLDPTFHSNFLIHKQLFRQAFFPAWSAPWYSDFIVGSPCSGCHSSWPRVKPGPTKLVSIHTTVSHGLDYSTALQVPRVPIFFARCKLVINHLHSFF